jgi:hypothetical protein
MLGTREIILTLAKKGEPMTKHAITKATGKAPTNVGKYCKQLRKIGILNVEEVKHPSQTYWPYSLSYEGRLVALAIDLATEHGTGIDRMAITKELVDDMPIASPFHKFAQKVDATLIERGRIDVVQDWMRRIVESAYMNGYSDPFEAAFLAVSGFNVSDKLALKVIDDVFATMNKKDMIATKLFIKHSIQTQVIEEIVRQDKGKEFFDRTVENPDVLYMPYKCLRCGYYDPRRETTLREFLVARMTNRSFVCRGCRMWVKMDYDKDNGVKKAPVQITAPSTAP